MKAPQWVRLLVLGVCVHECGWGVGRDGVWAVGAGGTAKRCW